MNVTYDRESDVLYIRLDPAPREVANETFEKDPFFVVFDIDGDDRIAGIEILDASKRVNLDELAPFLRGDTAAAGVAADR
jgi:uncharacterized protein YuzE